MTPLSPEASQTDKQLTWTKQPLKNVPRTRAGDAAVEAYRREIHAMQNGTGTRIEHILAGYKDGLDADL